MRLTWKRQPHETGLRRVCQGERGYNLRLDSETVASVRLDRSIMGEGRGYFWSCPARDLWPWHNTAAEGVFFATADEAKADCKAWIVAAIERAKGGAR